MTPTLRLPRLYQSVAEGRRITILENGKELCIVYVIKDDVLDDPDSWQKVADWKAARIIRAMELVDLLRQATK